MEAQGPCRNAHFPYSKAQSTIHSISPTRGKSCTYLICKVLFLALFLIVIPLFPSQAPDFLNQQPVITKFWELIHLLFIGIVVSYGLFSRRKVDVGSTETHSRFDNFQSDMSKMFLVSSNLEDGYEYPSGSAKKRQVQSLDAQYFKGEPTNMCCDGNTAIDEHFKTNMPIYENGPDNWCHEYGEKDVFQSWNSQYFLGESLVVVAQPNFATSPTVDDKPLGLPVRSLKSRSRKWDSLEFTIENESLSSTHGSSECSDNIKAANFGDSDSENLQLKFGEAVVSPSPIPQRSRSQRVEMKENLAFVSRSHFRPLSVDETQFESHKTLSLKSKLSFPSQASASSMSSYSSGLDSSPPRSSCSSSELLNSRLEDVGTESFQEFSTSGSSLPSKAMIGSCFGSSYQNEVLKGSKDYMTELRISEGEDQIGSKELKWEGKNKSLSKASSSRGKSVRTIRSGGLNPKAPNTKEVNGKQIGDDCEKKCDDVGSIHIKKDGVKKSEGIDRLVMLQDNNSEGNLDKPSGFAKPTLRKHQKKELKELSGNVSVETAKSNTQIEKFGVNSKEDAVSGPFNDTNVDSDEVDKKAGEFIAKFREQIRLQKLASFRKHIGDSYFN